MYCSNCASVKILWKSYVTVVPWVCLYFILKVNYMIRHDRSHDKTCLCHMLTTKMLVSSIGCVSDWYSGGCRFDPAIRQHSFVEIGHKIFSNAIFSLPLIQVSCQLRAKNRLTA